MDRSRPVSATFFGSSLRVAEAVNAVVPIARIYSERRHFNRDIFTLAKYLDVPFSEMETRADLGNLDPAPGAVGFSYGVGIIFQRPQIDAFSHGIWNCHTGKLPDLRGRHPISWALIKGHRRLTMTIHKINERIDQGEVLAAEDIARNMNDTEAEIHQKFFGVLENGLIRTAVYNYVAGKTVALGEGEYLHSLTGVHKRVDLSHYDAVALFHLFKSQAVHGGIAVGNYGTFTECVFFNEDHPHQYEGFTILRAGDGQKIALR